jgi:hypothetical protein
MIVTIIIIIIIIISMYLFPYLFTSSIHSIVANYTDSKILTNIMMMTRMIMAMTIMTVLHTRKQMNQPHLSGDIFSLDLMPKSSFGTP